MALAIAKKDYHTEITNKNLSFLNTPYAKLIYHYTSKKVDPKTGASPYQSIIGSRILRSSNILTMKDKKEFKAGIQEFERLLNKYNKTDDLAHILKILDRDFLKGNKFQVFITCFTYSSVSKFHWSYYGNRNSGGCISVAPQKLNLTKTFIQAFPSGQPANMHYLGKVRYSKRFQRKCFRMLINSYDSLYQEVCKTMKNQEEAKIDIAWLSLGVLQVLVVLASLFKTSGFTLENEYRAVVFLTQGTPFTNPLNNNTYVELDF